MRVSVNCPCLRTQQEKGLTMALFEVVLSQSYGSQQIINRWTYEGSGVPASVSMSFALISALGAIPSVGVYDVNKLMRKIAGTQVSAVSFVGIQAKNIYLPTDFYATPFTTPLTGDNAGEGMSPANATGYRTNLVRTDISRAYKRFAGVSESNVGALGGMNSGFVTGAMAALAAEMTEVQTYVDEGNTLTFAPVVLSKLKYDPNPNNPDGNHVAYKYYATEALQLQHIARSIIWEPYNTMRTQTSRQYGRGR